MQRQVVVVGALLAGLIALAAAVLGALLTGEPLASSYPIQAPTGHVRLEGWWLYMVPVASMVGGAFARRIACASRRQATGSILTMALAALWLEASLLAFVQGTTVGKSVIELIELVLLLPITALVFDHRTVAFGYVLAVAMIVPWALLMRRQRRLDARDRPFSNLIRRTGRTSCSDGQHSSALKSPVGKEMLSLRCVQAPTISTSQGPPSVRSTLRRATPSGRVGASANITPVLALRMLTNASRTGSSSHPVTETFTVADDCARPQALERSKAAANATTTFRMRVPRSGDISTASNRAQARTS